MPALRPPAGPGAAAAPGALEPARQILERAWRLPAAPGAAGPPAGPGLLRSLGLVGAVAAGALFSSSRGELALLQLQGKVPQDIGLRQWQRAGAALERWNPQWRLPDSSTPEQVGQLVRRAAELDDRLSSRQITPQQFRRAMGELVRALQPSPGPRAQPPAATTSAAAPPPAARPQPQALAAPGLARLREALHAHQATPTARTRDTLNDELAHTASLHRRHGARWPAETAARYGELATRARSALAQPLHAARASEAVQQLGRAIRAHHAQPADPARREALNDALALARSLHEDRHAWTPATQRNFEAWHTQAVHALAQAPKDAAPNGAARNGTAPNGTAPATTPARLPQLGVPADPASRPRGLPLQRAEVTHTGRVATVEEIATRQREAIARALRGAAAIYYDRKKTLLAGGSEAALAEAVYKDTPLHTLGVSLAQFQAHLQAGQEPTGAAGARIRAGAETGGSGIPRMSQAELEHTMASLLTDWDSQIAGLALPRILSVQPGDTDIFDISIQDRHSGSRQPATLTLTLRVYKDAHDPAVVQLHGLLGTGSAFANTLYTEYAFELPARIAQGQLMIPGYSPVQPLAVGHREGWRPGGFRNATENTHLPEAFWNPDISREQLELALRKTSPRDDPSWRISSTQELTILALFEYRDLLGALTNHRFTTRDEARGALFQSIALIEALNPKALQTETGWWLYPRDDTTWGISLPIIGKGFETIGGALGMEASVQSMTPSMRLVQGAISQAWEFVHTHPSNDGRKDEDSAAGFSIQDVVALLAAYQPGEALSVHDNGAQYRLTLAPDAQNLPASLRLKAATMLRDFHEETIKIGNASIVNPSLTVRFLTLFARLEMYLNGLPLKFQRFSESQSNSRPINAGLPLGPTDEKIPKTPLPPIPSALEEHFQKLRQRLAP